MKILFAVSNESISQQIVKKYESLYKEIVSSKNVYYFNAILKELQKNKSYDRIVISEDLEPFTNKNYEITDNFIFEKLDRISDEAIDNSGEDIPIILIASDRRTAGENILSKLFGIGIYSTLIGSDRTVQKLCELINKPRTKKEAKIYYRIDANETDYKPESEDNVSEMEIQSILAHYKKLGRNEDKYVESFNSIANQYTDEQLKVIIKFLPIGVKAVLEANSPKYQQIATFSGENSALKGQKPYNSSQINPKTKRPRSTDQAVVDNGIKIESIDSKETKKPTKPVVIPGTLSTNNVKKLQKNDKQQNKEDNFEQEDVYPEIIENMENLVEQHNAHRRGRPRKVLSPEEIAAAEARAKRGRGRPKKHIEEIERREENKQSIDDILDDIDDIDDETALPGFEGTNTRIMDDNQEDNFEEFEIDDKPVKDQIIENETEEDEENDAEFLPSFEAIEEDNLLTFDEPAELPGFEEIENDTYNKQDSIQLSQIDSKRNENDRIIQNNTGKNRNIENRNIENIQEKNEPEIMMDDYIENQDSHINNQSSNQLQNYNNISNNNLTGLVSADKKIVAFVGTSKNGTSFLVNSLADMFSRQGIKTAIVDLTQNRNDYYIYTKNEEALRKIATECMNKLVIGTAQGVPVNKNLDVYTSLPGEHYDDSQEDFEKILTTLVKNYSLVLLDCDFKTNYGYIRQAQELYLVQSMDVLTIQPLTAYLRDLKAKNALDEEKLRIIINKFTRVRSVTERTIIGGMAFYNDPSMSFMSDELFNREKIRYCVVPFDPQTYSKYLEGIINCNITVNGYSKEVINCLNKLTGMVYPLITGNALTKAKKQNQMNYNNYNNYNTNNTFSDQMNNTLDRMKNKF